MPTKLTIGPPDCPIFECRVRHPEKGNRRIGWEWTPDTLGFTAFVRGDDWDRYISIHRHTGDPFPNFSVWHGVKMTAIVGNHLLAREAVREFLAARIAALFANVD